MSTSTVGRLSLTSFLYGANSARRDLAALGLPQEFTYTHYVSGYDVTAALKEGENLLAIWLGNGWYHQRERFADGQCDYGNPRVRGSLVVEYGDGERFFSTQAGTFPRSPAR